MTFEESLIEHCSPTLAGMKVASLYRYSTGDSRQFGLQYKLWREWFARLGLKLVILKGCRETDSYLLYLYREDALRRLLARPDVCGYLSCLDYDPGAGHRALLRQLSRRLCLEREFPHEIGIFLGYPLADVQGFIQNKGRNYTCCGCWKSYGDPRIARRRFNRYRVCTAVYKRRYAGGTPITQLIKAA